MSDTTRAALDDAIAAHVAEEFEGHIVTAWVVVTETTTLDMLDSEESSMVTETRAMQSDYLTQGLLYAALHVTDADRRE